MSLYEKLELVHGTGEILHDAKNDWVKVKKRSEAVAKSFDPKEPDFNPSNVKYWTGRYERMNECGSVLEFAVAKNGDKRLIKANFCRDRMCPGCQKRRSLILFHQVKNVCLSIKEDYPTYKYLLLTLTVPNVKADELSDEIKHIHASWDRMSRRAFFKKSVKGWFRALEVTYNGERDDYHPHLHILLCVPSNYFTINYITQDKWLQSWQEATRYPEITQVDVRRVKPNPKRPDSDALASATAEVAKYAVKPSNYVGKWFDGSYRAVHNVVRELAQGIARKRMVAFGGLMKEYAVKLELKSVEDDDIDLAHATETTSDIDAVMRQVYRWNVGLNLYMN